MGRSFESVRMGAKDVSARWAKASRAMEKGGGLCSEAGGDGRKYSVSKNLKMKQWINRLYILVRAGFSRYMWGFLFL